MSEENKGKLKRSGFLVKIVLIKMPSIKMENQLVLMKQILEEQCYSKGSFKSFTGYIHIGNVFPIPLYIKLPQMN